MSTGDKCAIYVLEPRPTASTEVGRLEQALQVASDALISGGTLTDDSGDPTPLSRAFHGSSGNFSDYTGLTMRINDRTRNIFDLTFTVIHSQSSAVPLRVIEPQDSTWDCVGYNGEFELDVATCFIP